MTTYDRWIASGWASAARDSLGWLLLVSGCTELGLAQPCHDDKFLPSSASASILTLTELALTSLSPTTHLPHQPTSPTGPKNYHSRPEKERAKLTQLLHLIRQIHHQLQITHHLHLNYQAQPQTLLWLRLDLILTSPTA